MSSTKVSATDAGAGKLTHYAYNDVLKAVHAEVPVFMVGPAGTGKTTIAKQVADAKGLTFYYAGSVESPFQLRGFIDAQGRIVKTPFRLAYENGGLFLFDELDASDPQAIVTVHAALDNGVMDCPDGMVPRHKDFHYIAAGNTWGNGANLDYIGRNALDGATLDRYAFEYIDYDAAMEMKIAKEAGGREGEKWALVVQQARKAVSDLGLRHIVSTRAIRYGAKLLKAGFDVDAVFAKAVVKGLPQDDVVKIKKKIDFSATELKKAVDPAAKSMVSVADAFAQAGDSIKKIEDMEAFIKSHEKEFDKVLEARRRTEVAAKKINEIKVKYIDQSDVIEKASREIEINMLQAEKSKATLATRTSRVADYMGSIDVLAKEVEKLANSASEARGTLTSKKAELDTLSEKMAKAAKQASNTLSSATDSLDTIESLTRRLKTLEPGAKEVAQAAGAALRKLENA